MGDAGETPHPEPPTGLPLILYVVGGNDSVTGLVGYDRRAVRPARTRRLARLAGVSVPIVFGVLVLWLDIPGVSEGLTATIGTSLIIQGVALLVAAADPRGVSQGSDLANLLTTTSKLVSAGR